MANFDLKYDFTPHLENTEETEEFNWKTLEKISLWQWTCLSWCLLWHMVHVSTSDKAAHGIRIRLK